MRAFARNTLLLLAIIFVTNGVIEDRDGNHEWEFWLLFVLAAACAGIREQIPRKGTT